ncbi:MAG: hypothetical protein M4579_002709 [Chaenotheca gracillima]|nr:MAG: hypothetical protein M4579_002709 [Chaenotheca gracillima]
MDNDAASDKERAGEEAEGPDSPAASPAESPSTTEDVAPQKSTTSAPPRLPPLRSITDPPSVPSLTTSTNPIGSLNAARRPGPPPSSASSMRGAGGLPQDMQAKMKAFHLSRQGAPPINPSASQGMFSPSLPGSAGRGAPNTPSGPLAGGAAPGGRPNPGFRPPAQNWSSSPAIPGPKGSPKPSLGARRGLKLPGGLPGSPSATPSAGQVDTGTAPPAAAGQTEGSETEKKPDGQSGSLFNKFSEFVDTKTGTLKFKGKATIHGDGVEFSSGRSFRISLDEVDNLEELGKGNYGTVYKVRHSRPRLRRPGLGLNNPNSFVNPPQTPTEKSGDDQSSTQSSPNTPTSQSKGNTTTGVIMGMKEIRLELDEAKFAAIIMELDILHRCISPFIIDFYGAFFQEGAVYICMEYMDGGSIDKLYGDGVPENILRKITVSTVMGLKSLKEDHNIIHRDVKPTNILVNTRGQVKICDFGVSGNLVASIARTNIGCQSYMAPERIASGGVAQAGANPGGGTYSVQSDIWSLGLTIIECAMGRYPYAPETYNNIFSQLSAIVDGDPPDLPEDGFSDAARDFVRGCLHKIPKLRPTYAMLLRHAWLAELLKPPTITEEAEAEDVAVAAAAAAAPLPEPAASPVTPNGFPDTADKEVAAWVADALEKRRRGTMTKAATPALHAAPLDAVPSPSLEDSVSKSPLAAA